MSGFGMGTKDRRKGKEGEKAMKAIADRLRKLAQEAVEIAELIDGMDTIASSKGLQVIECKHCGKPFKQRTLWHSYCTSDCKAQAHGFTDENHAKQAANRKRRKA
jgi:ribosomal protein L22